ncbi:hypothetical protein KKG29_04680 [Patescibacteria group bacterium]|nr:hypothetical protein [Patescibacteria group bacterium]MBU4000433.1 hypothetical protein [Patescibacteria group bacterium]MBU4057208.1 hypothetical protein [Patescibacteria group bacterium]MBU4368230.1 hypothetical protein [Patescibacteria group bacterium]
MNDEQNNEVIYPITIGDLQNDAVKRIGRKLTDDELYTAKKCVECGISFVMDIALKAAIEEAVEKNRQTKCRVIRGV